MIDQRARLAAEGMYRPDMESDACGVGLVAATDGKPSRRVVADMMQAKARTSALSRRAAVA